MAAPAVLAAAGAVLAEVQPGVALAAGAHPVITQPIILRDLRAGEVEERLPELIVDPQDPQATETAPITVAALTAE